MYATAHDFARLRASRPEPAYASLARRLLVGAALLLALLGAGFAHVAQGSAPSAYETVTVAPGDTLWGLAERRYPNEDVRRKVDEIERVNRLSSAEIHPGDTLKLPSS